MDAMTDYGELAQELHTGGPPRPDTVWRHYKTGALYIVKARAIDVVTLTPVVVYQSAATGYVWVRPLEAWRERIPTANGTVPRFERVRE